MVYFLLSTDNTARLFSYFLDVTYQKGTWTNENMSRKNDQIDEWALKSATYHMKDKLSERAY